MLCFPTSDIQLGTSLALEFQVKKVDRMKLGGKLTLWPAAENLSAPRDSVFLIPPLPRRPSPPTEDKGVRNPSQRPWKTRERAQIPPEGVKIPRNRPRNRRLPALPVLGVVISALISPTSPLQLDLCGGKLFSSGLREWIGGRIRVSRAG